MRSEKGAIMVLAAACFTILLLFAGMALDLGRAHLMKARVQTAVDAAALAGALQVVPMVEISIHRWVAGYETCLDPVTGEPYDCLVWDDVSPVVLSGSEESLILSGGWLTLSASQCSWPYRCAAHYHVLQEWLFLPSSTSPVATATFHRNANWPGGDLGARVTSLSVQIDQSKAEVTATAAIRLPTVFLKLVGMPELSFTRTGSAVPVRRR